MEYTLYNNNEYQPLEQGNKYSPTWPFRMIVARSSNSGKTTMIMNLLIGNKMADKENCPIYVSQRFFAVHKTIWENVNNISLHRGGSLFDIKNIISRYTGPSDNLISKIDDLTMKQEFVVFDLRWSKNDPLSIRDITNEIKESFFEKFDLLPTTEELSEILLTPFKIKIPIIREKYQTWISSWKEKFKYFIIDEQENTLAARQQGILYRDQKIIRFPKYDRLMGCTWEKLSQAFGQDIKIDHNVTDKNTTIVHGFHPDYLIWMKNILVLKGEEKINDIDKAISELSDKNELWNLSMYHQVPYILCYAAGGNKLQFFATKAQDITTISPCCDLSNTASELK
ncbi:5284_t:CDS:2, partial [Entrophospora sp. SA101]